MPPKLITVVGATGAQGGSTIDHLLQQPPGQYKVRAITRNPSSPASQALVHRGVEVIHANLDSIPSLIAAFKDSYAIFAVTDYWGLFSSPDVDKDAAAALEAQQGKNLADAALAILSSDSSSSSSLQHYIWSSLPDTAHITSNHHDVPHYRSKAAVTSYITSKPALLDITTFLWSSYYATNLLAPSLRPIPTSTGKYIQLQTAPADTPLPFIGNARANLGAFTLSILNQPERTRAGTTVLAYIKKSTLDGILQAWASAKGVEARYVRVPRETYVTLFPKQAEEMHLAMAFWDSVRDREWMGRGVLTHEELGVDLRVLVGMVESFGEVFE